MKVPRRSPRRRAVLLTIAFTVVGLMVVATFAQSQGKSYTPRNNERDPRNKILGEIHGNNPANDCWKHHQGEGMRDTVIVYPVIPAQIPIGKQTDIEVQIVNPWKQELRDMSLEVSLIGEQILTVEGSAANVAAATDVKYSMQRCLGPSQETPVDNECKRLVSITFDIPTGAEKLIANIELHPSSPGQVGTQVQPDEYRAGFRYSTAKVWRDKAPADNGTNNPAHLQNLTRTLVSTLAGAGTGVLEIEHSRGTSVRTDVFVNMTILMGQAGGAGDEAEKSYSIKVPFDNVLKQSAETMTVKVTPFAAGTQQMEFKVRAQNYYKHQDGGTPNEDYYSRYAVLTDSEDLIRGNTITPMRALVVGPSYIASPYGPAPPPEISEDWKFVMAEISGFAAAGLLLPSLLLGGTYGKGSRRFFNAILGGAKRRVMYHNLLSLALSLVAVVHVVLFMLEIRYTILMGVLWGGLGTLSLLVLGLTGYYQVPLIQRHGYKWWRFTHLTFGLLVVLFVSYHAIADGPDFFFIKEQLPKWINDVNLSQK